MKMKKRLVDSEKFTAVITLTVSGTLPTKQIWDHTEECWVTATSATTEVFQQIVTSIAIDELEEWGFTITEDENAEIEG
jgi:hypothetical protein